LDGGARVALVSDAGLPGVNDPGARLVVAAMAHGVPVTVLPGASAVETALVASGLAGAQYRFLGYLPRREAERAALWRELARWPHPAVAFESPKRLPAALASLARALPERPIAVCRELTKRFEEVVCARALELAARFAEAPKGEITLVIGAARFEPGVEVAPAILEALGELAAAGVSRRRAAALLARVTGVPTNRLYDEGL
jgi:16S rRNA (cytidine1402-2'-O)-methyltransferase